MNKNISLLVIITIALFAFSLMNAQQCAINNATILHSGDDSSNRYKNTPGLANDNLLPFVTVSSISGGTYVDSSGQTFCSTTMLNGSAYKKTGVGTSYNAAVFYNYTISTAANAPVIYVNRFSALLTAFDGTLNNPSVATNQLSYYVRVSITDGSTSTETVIVNSVLINQTSPVSAAADYKMQPGRTYTVKYYVWKATNSCTDLYLDNPRLFLSPIPKTTISNICSGTLSGTVSSALAPYISSAVPANLTLRWLQGSTNVSDNQIAAGSYTPYYYNASSNCYMPAGESVTVTSSPSGVSVAPASQTVVVNGSATNLNVTATGASVYQWYSNTTNSNTGGTLIAGATSSSYTPPTNAAGVYYYYVVANNGTCSTTSPAVQVNVQNCNAGNNPPVISSFTN